MTNPPTDERREAFERWALDNGHPTTTRDDGTDRYVSTLTALRWHGWQAALSHQGEVVAEVTVCCSRRECGGECANEWEGMRSVRRSGEDTIMAIMGADNMDHAIRILDEYANLTALISKAEKV